MGDFTRFGGGGALGFKQLTNKVSFTSSGNWTVPAGVNEIEIWATGGGGGGSDGANITQFSQFCTGGGAAATVVNRYVVTPGKVLSFVIGASAANSNGGSTVVNYDGLPILIVGGGIAGQTSTSTNGGLGTGSHSESGLHEPVFSVTGGDGRSGTKRPKVISRELNVGISTDNVNLSFGGGSSYYGTGGNSGVFVAGGQSSNGQMPPGTSYGAGGGAGGAYNAGNRPLGAAGLSGIVEVWY